MSCFLRGTAPALIKMGNATRHRCEQCPRLAEKAGNGPNAFPPTRCCDKYFCEISEITARELGWDGERTNHPRLPFMGEEGCVIPPQFRPVCTGFVCPQHFEADPKFRMQHARLQKKIANDPNVRRAVDKAKMKMGGVRAAIERFQEEHPIDEETPPQPPPQGAIPIEPSE